MWKEFEIIISAEDIQKSKPDPEVYEKAFNGLNEIEKLEKEDSLAIEDSLVGVESAQNAGIKVIAIPNKNSFNKEEDFSIADYTINSFEDEKLKEIVLG